METFMNKISILTLTNKSAFNYLITTSLILMRYQMNINISLNKIKILFLYN
jgi:hypothetical protein